MVTGKSIINGRDKEFEAAMRAHMMAMAKYGKVKYYNRQVVAFPGDAVEYTLCATYLLPYEAFFDENPMDVPEPESPAEKWKWVYH